METELNTLENKLQQLVTLYRLAREDNLKLRQEVAGLYQANQKLVEKITTAQTKLSSIMQHIPEDTHE